MTRVVGPGFCPNTFAEVINEALLDVDPSIRVISEPGRYYVTSAFKAVAYVHGKKTIAQGSKKMHMYYLNDGIYGSLGDKFIPLPRALNKSHSGSEEKHLSTLWGPTLDSLDCISKEVYLPEFQIGDWLYWDDMGAYTSCLASHFNGFAPPTIYPIMRRSSWDSFCAEIRKVENKQVVLTSRIDVNDKLKSKKDDDVSSP